MLEDRWGVAELGEGMHGGEEAMKREEWISNKHHPKHHDATTQCSVCGKVILDEYLSFHRKTKHGEQV